MKAAALLSVLSFVLGAPETECCVTLGTMHKIAHNALIPGHNLEYLHVLPERGDWKIVVEVGGTDDLELVGDRDVAGAPEAQESRKRKNNRHPIV